MIQTIEWLDLETVVTFHDKVIAEHGGLAGIRDLHILESALARPQNLHHYKHLTLPELAAIYASSIIRNHPFHDANKRTGHMCMRIFLRLNDISFVFDPTQIIKTLVDVAAGTINEDEFVAFVTNHCYVANTIN